MSSEESKQVAARAAQVIFNDHDLDQIPELFAPDFIDHGAPDGAPQGPEGQRVKVVAFIAAFPDLHISYSHQIAEGDLVAVRFVLTGTHDGEFAGDRRDGKHHLAGRARSGASRERQDRRALDDDGLGRAYAAARPVLTAALPVAHPPRHDRAPARRREDDGDPTSERRTS